MENWREKINIIIFEADTPFGKAFDLVLIYAIVASVLVVMLESVETIRMDHGPFLRGAEWVFTILFTIEYVLRLITARHTWGYARSFFGIVDLLAVIPTYLSAFVPGTQFLVVIRLLRILRIFRVLKLAKYLREASYIVGALRSSLRKITVFLFGVSVLVVILGSMMYLIEGEQNGFTSIPRSIYWAVVTLTTVGYGDISPQTPLGQFFASIVMIIGYAIIAVPTGIVSAEMTLGLRKQRRPKLTCEQCGHTKHEQDAIHCKHCGTKLTPSEQPS